MIPVVKYREVDPSLRVDMFSLSDHHVGGGPQEAYRRRERERVQKPQLDGEVVGAALKREAAIRTSSDIKLHRQCL